MSLGVALVGSGIFAREEHLPAIQKTPHLTLRAVYSRSLKSAEALAAGTPEIDLYSEDAGEGKTYADLLKRDDIHAVIIALPIVAQPQYIEAAINATKHVLSEKPIAKDVKDAENLLKFYHDNKGNDSKDKAEWSVAENFRFHSSLLYAREQIQQMGRLFGFRVNMYGNVKRGGKYFETAWRKTPSYQGGFLLDGGVHYAAALRFLLGESNRIVKVSAQTSQLQEHLPPIDTLDAVLRCESGVSGTFSVSFGTTFPGSISEYAIACEQGTVTISKSGKVVVRDAEGKEDESRSKDFTDQGAGVKEEVQVWAKNLAEKTLQDPRQTPEEALKDLALLEAMFVSGTKSGDVVELSNQ
ncbi:MAG: hypothetical protein M1823_005995 [Watsoniomyces obsoletus]|nr:MAG: hypothetical protein M1823_005995 [Watsoniomyces obsoletus]